MTATDGGIHSEQLRDRLRVYLVADFSTRPPARVFEATSSALAAGVTAVQYRDKSDATAAQRGRRVARLRRLTQSVGALLIVNDDPRLALALKADGVHLGPTDAPVGATRRWLPDDLLIGASAGSVERARRLESEGADYLGVGAIFEARATKADAAAPAGLGLLSEVLAAVATPVVAIGGIACHNAGDVFATGVHGVAVVRAILEAGDPAGATRILCQAGAAPIGR